MNKKIFKLDIENNTPVEIVMNTQENETHTLIKTTKLRNCKALNLVLDDNTNSISKKIPVKSFTQLNLTNYTSFSINADFVDAADSYLEMEVYTGTWEEMILTEVEISFSDSPFYISCNNDVKEFIIGEENNSRMEIKPYNNGGFSIKTFIVHSPTEIEEIKNNIAFNTTGVDIIGRLYGRIKGRINGKDFHQRQEENKEIYAVNFNKTLLEGFRPC